VNGQGVRPDATTVVLVDFPLDLFLRSRRYNEALLREFAFIAETDVDEASIPARLVKLVAEIRARFMVLNADIEEQLERADARGDASVNLLVHLLPQGRQAALDLVRLFDDADEFCRRGDLLTLAVPAEFRSLREWYFGECVRQMDGEAPTSWPAWQAARV